MVWAGLADSELDTGAVRSNIAAFPLDSAALSPALFDLMRVIGVAADFQATKAPPARGVGHGSQRSCNRFHRQFIFTEPVIMVLRPTLID